MTRRGFSGIRKEQYEAKWSLIRKLSMLATIIIIPSVMVGSWLSTEPFAEGTEAHGELVAYHHHVRLQVFENGESIAIPANIGIGQSDAYGPSGMTGAHTHDASGTVHIESKDPNKQFTLGDFLNVWGYDTEGKTLSIPKDHVLTNGEVLRLDVTD